MTTSRTTAYRNGRPYKPVRSTTMAMQHLQVWSLITLILALAFLAGGRL